MIYVEFYRGRLGGLSFGVNFPKEFPRHIELTATGISPPIPGLEAEGKLLGAETDWTYVYPQRYTLYGERKGKYPRYRWRGAYGLTMYGGQDLPYREWQKYEIPAPSLINDFDRWMEWATAKHDRSGGDVRLKAGLASVSRRLGSIKGQITRSYRRALATA